MNHVAGKQNIIDKIGMPSNLFWGYIGIIIFMIGDGLEQGWISPYMIERGLSIESASLMFSVYGIGTAISAWLSGVFVQILGPKRTMMIGFCMFAIGSILFICLGVIPFSYPLMLTFYLIRGFGYPLFSFGFLVWITYRTPQAKLAAAVGWFWFVFSLGMSVIGPFYSSLALPKIGHINTLWTSLIFVTIGAILALVVNRDTFDIKRVSSGNTKAEFLKGITIMYKNPKVTLGGIVKAINGLTLVGFAVFLPTYLQKYGFSTSEWLKLYGSLFIVAIIFNLIIGTLGDKIGWRTTIAWIGGVGSAVATLAVYYTPQLFGHNYFMMLLAMSLCGATVAGYVPLTALVTSLDTQDKGAAMSVLNLGGGLGGFIAPTIVGIFIGPLGVGGVMWIFAILFLASAVMTKFLTLPDEKKESKEEEENHKAVNL
ncbi:MFS transporter [Peribacillus sp. TH16]|uniref:MFS transporter n=1 Tax=Peribacillus sp. TH16 TaxID=2798482 RepID=UPI0019132961|nr:MFS transporter [Peribacillus sp. TH16]MBK5482514.1 MFS transporter [Peribacillus sp. TH16]